MLHNFLILSMYFFNHNMLKEFHICITTNKYKSTEKKTSPKQDRPLPRSSTCSVSLESSEQVGVPCLLQLVLFLKLTLVRRQQVDVSADFISCELPDLPCVSWWVGGS